MDVLELHLVQTMNLLVVVLLAVMAMVDTITLIVVELQHNPLVVTLVFLLLAAGVAVEVSTGTTCITMLMLLVTQALGVALVALVVQQVLLEQ
jgi:hypothetical protein